MKRLIARNMRHSTLENAYAEDQDGRFVSLIERPFKRASKGPKIRKRDLR